MLSSRSRHETEGAATGCGRIYGLVEEVKAFINEKQEAILEISKKLEADPTEAGVDEARKVFNDRALSYRPQPGHLRASRVRLRW